MENTMSNQQKRQQDILQRIEHRLNVLEERATALLSNTDFESMTPSQRLTAASRLSTVMIDLLKLRKQCTGPDEAIEQFLSNMILAVENAIKKSMEY